MAFRASYTYKINDQYTAPLKKIAAETKQYRKLIASNNAELRNYRKEMRGAIQATKDLGKASSRSLKALNQDLKQTARQASGITKQKKGFKDAGTALTGFVAAAGLKSGFSAIKDEAFALEQSIVNLKKAFDFKTDDELKLFTEGLSAVKNEIGLSKTEINDLAFQAGKLGLPKDEVAGFASLVGKTAVAFESDLGSATKVLADLRTKFGLNNRELQLTLGTVNTLADNTSANANDILEVTQRLSGQFKALNVPPELASGFAAVARQISVTPELAASGMKQFIQGLQDTKKVGKDVGIALQKDFSGTIFKVLKSLNKLPKETRSIKVQEMFGRDAASFVLNLMNSTDVLNKTLGLTADKTKNMLSLDKEFNRQRETGIFLQQQTSAAWKDFKAILGTIVLPVIKSLIVGLTGVLTKVSSFAEKHPTIVKVVMAFGAFAAVAAAIAGGLAILGAAIPAVVAGVSALGVVFAVLTGPIGLIVAGVTMITTGFLGLLAEGGKVASMLKSIGSTIDSIFGTTWGSEAASGITDFAKDLFGAEEQKVSVEKKTQNQQSVNLDGSLRIQAEPGTKVLGGSMKKNAAGNLGLNFAAVGAS